MKRVLFCYLLLLLSACNQAGENTEKETAQSTEAIIADIDKEIESINQNLAAYKMETSDLMGESTEGGELKSYAQNGALKKAVVTYYGEMGKAVEEYYFSGDQLLFSLRQEYAYDRPISVEGSQVKSVEENRYYFHEDQLVRWLDTNKEAIASEQYKQKASELLQQVKTVKEKSVNTQAEQMGEKIDMRAIFEKSPLSIFDETTEGLGASEKKSLLEKGKSKYWEITDEANTKLVFRSAGNDQVDLYFLKYKHNSGGLLAVQTINGQSTKIQLWKYRDHANDLERASDLKAFKANDFLSSEDQLPDSHSSPLQYGFIDDQTVEVSLNTWMDEAFEKREISNRIFLKWNGESFEERIEKISSDNR